MDVPDVLADVDLDAEGRVAVMDVGEALEIVEHRVSWASADIVEETLAAEVRRLRDAHGRQADELRETLAVLEQVRKVRDAMERGVYGSAEEAADVLSRALRGAL